MNKWIFVWLILPGVFACKNAHEPVSTAKPYTFNIPAGFPYPKLSEANPMTEEGIALGRRLFYDQILSSNGRSCSYCHLQEKAFSANNADYALDPGVYMNIPSLVNLAWNPDFGWYGAEPDLDHVAIGDFGPLFFNSDLEKVISDVKKDPEYVQLFGKVFPGQDIFSKAKFPEKTAFAIAQFIRSIVSADSKFDKFRAGKTNFSSEELYGFEIFNSEKGDCFHCHTIPLFTDNDYHNTGLDSVYTGLFNKGYFNISGRNSDLGRFSSPTLRNIALTAPYMHDGRFQTLEEVIDFYDHGVHPTATTDPLMTKNGVTTKLNLSAFEKKCLKKFLLTLTDSVLIENTIYAKPD